MIINAFSVLKTVTFQKKDYISIELENSTETDKINQSSKIK